VSATFQPRYSTLPMPANGAMQVVDELTTSAPVESMFALVRLVEEWPLHLRHYRYVRFRERSPDGGGLVEMSANRPFGPAGWPTWWLSEMTVNSSKPAIRFRHVGGVTKGMDVEWSFERATGGTGTHVQLVHIWNGPSWPIVGRFAAVSIIGPVFIHGIASRTLAGLARVAETRTGGRTA
jgi:ribosome-associated toxin RatA of RatAB toxin-antitoxin module